MKVLYKMPFYVALIKTEVLHFSHISMPLFLWWHIEAEGEVKTVEIMTKSNMVEAVLGHIPRHVWPSMEWAYWCSLMMVTAARSKVKIYIQPNLQN